VIAQIKGQDESRSGLVVHGHLDVVPANAEDWSVEPFSAQINEGMIWGRGAIDMKNMDAMIIAIFRMWARKGIKPPRNIVLAFFADEESGFIIWLPLDGCQSSGSICWLYRSYLRSRWFFSYSRGWKTLVFH